MKEDVFTLEEGDAVFQWPERLSQESYDDLEAWAKLILRKIKRSVGKDANEPTIEDDDVSSLGHPLSQTRTLPAYLGQHRICDAVSRPKQLSRPRTPSA